MYKILLVDDEQIVRESIKKNIKWDELGFELVDDCSNGHEAMESVDKFIPDVVITDICMPFIDGLELTRFIVQKYPRIKVIILTGYEEFDYAQQAVKLKAYDFILKPITARELKGILIKLKNELDEENIKLQNISKIEDQIIESIPLLREHFLNRLILGNMQFDNIEKKFDYFKIHFNGRFLVVFVVDVDGNGDFIAGTEDEIQYYAVFNICEEIVSKYSSGIAFQNNAEKTIVILSDEDSEILETKVISITEEIRQIIETHFKFTITIGIGKICNQVEALNDCYQYAVTALNHRFIQGKNHVISISNFEHQKSSVLYSRIEWDKKISEAIKSGTAEETDKIIENSISSLKTSFVSVSKCYEQVQQLFLTITDTLGQIGIDDAELSAEEFNVMPEISSFKTLSEIEEWLKKYCHKVNTFISNKRDKYLGKQAMAATEYINMHYMDEDISLNSICTYLSMSVSYFCTMFKTFTGETFIEFLTRMRMNKAKELLKTTDLKTYEIASKVGYVDAHYFGMIFKKTLKMTPTEYRERMQNENK
jgi:two-component system response regulator YesN